MDTLSMIFAAVVTVLAGLACIGALCAALVLEYTAIRRALDRHRAERRPTLTDPAGRWWRERSAVGVPERRS